MVSSSFALLLVGVVVCFMMAGSLIWDIREGEDGAATAVYIVAWGILCFAMGLLRGAHLITEVWKGFN